MPYPLARDGKGVEMIRESLEKLTGELVIKIMDDILDRKLKTERIKCRYCGSEIVWKYSGS
jgi:hypothetical protein